MYMKKCTTRLTSYCLKIYNILCGNYYVTTEEIIYKKEKISKNYILLIPKVRFIWYNIYCMDFTCLYH